MNEPIRVSLWRGLGQQGRPRFLRAQAQFSHRLLYYGELPDTPPVLADLSPHRDGLLVEWRAPALEQELDRLLRQSGPPRRADSLWGERLGRLQTVPMQDSGQWLPVELELAGAVEWYGWLSPAQKEQFVTQLPARLQSYYCGHALLARPRPAHRLKLYRALSQIV